MKTKEKKILKAVKRVEFDVRKVLSGVSLGVKSSTFKGHGMTFSDIRQYEPGDDIKNFAWQVMARTGEPHVKEFEEERDLEVHVAFDMSSSMSFGGKKLSKSMAQAYLLAFLGLSTAKSKDKFGGLIFSNKQIKRWPALRGEDHVRRCLYDLVDSKNSEKASDLNMALDYFLKLKSKNTLCILVSDFNCEVDRKLLAQVRRKHNLKCIHVFDPYEKAFPDLGWLSFSSLKNVSFLGRVSAKKNQSLSESFHKKLARLERLSKSFGIHLLHQSTHDVQLTEVTKSLQLRRAYG